MRTKCFPRKKREKQLDGLREETIIIVDAHAPNKHEFSPT